MAHFQNVPHHTNGDIASAYAIVHMSMESKGESRPSRIRLPYRDVHKFRNDGSEARKIPKMLWDMLQEMGYEK
jgi:hypothetical protein